MKIILKRGESAQSVPLPSVFLPETKGIVTACQSSSQDVGVFLRRLGPCEEGPVTPAHGASCHGSGHVSLQNPNLLQQWAVSVTLFPRGRLSPIAGPCTNDFTIAYQFFFSAKSNRKSLSGTIVVFTWPGEGNPQVLRPSVMQCSTHMHGRERQAHLARDI